MHSLFGQHYRPDGVVYRPRHFNCFLILVLTLTQNSRVCVLWFFFSHFFDSSVHTLLVLKFDFSWNPGVFQVSALCQRLSMSFVSWCLMVSISCRCLPPRWNRFLWFPCHGKFRWLNVIHRRTTYGYKVHLF